MTLEFWAIAFLALAVCFIGSAIERKLDRVIGALDTLVRLEHDKRTASRDDDY